MAHNHMIWEPTTSHWQSSWPGSEPPSVETDVYVWHYALLVVHARNEEDMITCQRLMHLLAHHGQCHMSSTQWLTKQLSLLGVMM